MRLVDDLAARRVLYPRPLVTLPDVLLIDIPAFYASRSLPMGRYYPVILETGAERSEMQAFLEADRPQPVAPSLFDSRPSALRGDTIAIAQYRPPGPSWPWLLLCGWPEDCVALVPPGERNFARGAYTTEVVATVEEVEHVKARLLATLRLHPPISLCPVSGIAGHA